jgi:hypothetical protein
MAVSTALGVLVTSDRMEGSLSIFTLWEGAGPARAAFDRTSGLVKVGIMGGPTWLDPLQFVFTDDDLVLSGCLAFTDGAEQHLVVTDHGNKAVHLVDVVRQVHMGYVATPGTIVRPHGVAARGSLVAVTCWGPGRDSVEVFRRTDPEWVPHRTIDGGSHLRAPHGLRFTSDGRGVVVANRNARCVSLFDVTDGSFARDLCTECSAPTDVHEVQGGWLVANLSMTAFQDVQIIEGDTVRRCTFDLGVGDEGYMMSDPVALAVLPGLGLLIREWGNGVKLWAPADDAVAPV